MTANLQAYRKIIIARYILWSAFDYNYNNLYFYKLTCFKMHRHIRWRGWGHRPYESDPLANKIVKNVGPTMNYVKHKKKFRHLDLRVDEK